MKLSLPTLLISLSLLVFSACQTSAEQPDTELPESSAGLLQHTVYFYLNDDVTPEEVNDFENGLNELLQIEEIYKAEMGSPAGTKERDVTDHAFAYSIFTWFESMDDYTIYDEHPDHLKFIDTYSHLWADVKVYDTETTYVR